MCIISLEDCIDVLQGTNKPNSTYQRQGSYVIDTRIKPGTYQRPDVPGVVRSAGDYGILALQSRPVLRSL